MDSVFIFFRSFSCFADCSETTIFIPKAKLYLLIDIFSESFLSPFPSLLIFPSAYCTVHLTFHVSIVTVFRFPVTYPAQIILHRPIQLNYALQFFFIKCIITLVFSHRAYAMRKQVRYLGNFD